MAHIPPPQPAPSQGGSGLNVVLMVLGVLGVLGVFCAGGLGFLFYRAFNQVNASALRSRDSNNMRQLTLALLNYESQYGSFPPPYVTDADGKPLYSWRVLILPQIEQSVLYEAWKKDEPWDSPHNQRIARQMPAIFQAPTSNSNNNKTTSSYTNYVAVVGDSTLFPPTGKGVRIAEVRDGLSNTIAIVPVANSDIHWAEPRDLNLETMPLQINSWEKDCISSQFPDGANVSFADGSVHFLHDATSSTTLRSLITRNGGEAVTVP